MLRTPARLKDRDREVPFSRRGAGAGRQELLAANGLSTRRCVTANSRLSRSGRRASPETSRADIRVGVLHAAAPPASAALVIVGDLQALTNEAGLVAAANGRGDVRAQVGHGFPLDNCGPCRYRATRQNSRYATERTVSPVRASGSSRPATVGKTVGLIGMIFSDKSRRRRQLEPVDDQKNENRGHASPQTPQKCGEGRPRWP
jgi:hypothetical protein